MFSLHATKKLLDRVKRPVEPAVAQPSTVLGNWYGNVLFWKPQVVLLVNERTLFPVLMPLAPAATVLERMPAALRVALIARGVDWRFIDVETAHMTDGRLATTASRSVLGIMNGFRGLAEAARDYQGLTDHVAIARTLSRAPCHPGGRLIWPDRELDAAVAEWSSANGDSRPKP